MNSAHVASKCGSWNERRVEPVVLLKAAGWQLCLVMGPMGASGNPVTLRHVKLKSKIVTTLGSSEATIGKKVDNHMLESLFNVVAHI